MIPDSKYRDIAKALLEKSRRDEVIWKPESEVAQDSFRVMLPESRIEIAFVSPAAELDYIVLTLHRSNGDQVGRWKVEEDSEDWTLVKALYEEAGRFVFGWDKVLSDIEKALAAKGPIGTAPRPSQRPPTVTARP